MHTSLDLGWVLGAGRRGDLLAQPSATESSDKKNPLATTCLTLEDVASLAHGHGWLNSPCSSEPHSQVGSWLPTGIHRDQGLGAQGSLRGALSSEGRSLLGLQGPPCPASPRLTHIQVVLHGRVQHHQVREKGAQVGDGALDDTL